MKSSQITVISWSHKNTAVAHRDALSLSTDDCVSFIDAAVHRSFIREAAIVSTCNRTEFYFISNRPESLRGWIQERYGEIKKLKFDKKFPDPLFLMNDDAIEHLMSVASGLESMMLGENQILAQVKAAHELLLSGGYPFPVLKRLFQEAVRSGKAVRTETALCEGVISVSLAAVELAHKIYRSFEKRKILVIGAGETAELVAFHFKNLDARQIIVANRGAKRRAALAEKIGAQAAISLEEIPEALIEVDVVVAATGSPRYLITAELLKPLMKKRDHRNLLLVDISTPRNIDPEIGRITEVFLYDIDHLEQVVSENLKKRRAEIPQAKKIIAQIVEEFLTWMQSLEVTPTIALLSEYFNSIREQELKKFVHKASDKEYEHMEQLTRSMVRKLLHYPIMHLRDMVNKQNLDMARVNTVREIFRLYELEESDKNK